MKTQEQPGFWEDPSKVKKIGQELKSVQTKLGHIKKNSAKIDDCQSIVELLETENDQSLFDELVGELASLQQDLETLRLDTLLTGKYDSYNAIVTLHAGAGGTEAQDWTQMLLRMYQMFAEKNGYKFSVLDLLDGDEAGIKSVSYKFCKCRSYARN